MDEHARDEVQSHILEELAELRAEVAALKARTQPAARSVEMTGESPTGDESNGELSRRGLLRHLGGAAAAGAGLAVGAATLGATPASAATGTVTFGGNSFAANDSGVDNTGWQSNSVEPTLAIQNITSSGNQGRGNALYAHTTNAMNADPAIQAISDGTNGMAFSGNGSAAGSTGVYGNALAIGVSGNGSGAGSTGVFGSGQAVGVSGSAPVAGGKGVKGVAGSSSGIPFGAAGVLGETGGAGAGVAGLNSNGATSGVFGVYGVAGSSSGLASNAGVAGDTTVATNAGVVGVNSVGTGVRGVYGHSADAPREIAGVVGSSTVGNGVTGATNQSSSIGVKGIASTPPATGVRGIAGAASSAFSGVNAGVVGEASFTGVTGVAGLSTSGVGVRGTHSVPANSLVPTDAGVVGSCQGSTGVVGVSDNGVGIFAAGGSAPLQLNASNSAGAPTTGLHEQGEIFVDVNGAIFQCVAGDGTSVGTWMRIGFNAISPVRLVSGVTIPALGTMSFPLAGNGGIPSQASAVTFILTVGSSQAGALTIYPADVPAPFTVGSIFPANQLVAGEVTAKVGAIGGSFPRTIKILNRGSAGATIYLDATGFYS